MHLWTVSAIVLLGCGPAPAGNPRGGRALGPQAAAEIFTTMLATYATAATYTDQGELVDVYTHENGRRYGTIASLNNSFLRPDRFRFVLGPESDFMGEPAPNDESVPQYQILRDGSRVISDFYLDEAPEELWTLDAALGAACGVSHGTSRLIAPLLYGTGKASVGLLSGYGDLMLGDDAVVDGVECLELGAKNSDGDELRVLVGKDDYLIRRVIERQSLPGKHRIPQALLASATGSTADNLSSRLWSAPEATTQ